MPMEALAAHGEEAGWHDTRPQGGACTEMSPAQSVMAPAATLPPLSDSDFHEPLGGLQMRELESPELFEHLFGTVTGQ